MEQYAQILNYAIPFFLVLIAIEYGASCFMHIGVNRLFDTISSLSSGLTNVIILLFTPSNRHGCYMFWHLLALTLPAIGSIDGAMRSMFSGTDISSTTAVKSTIFHVHSDNRFQKYLHCLLLHIFLWPSSAYPWRSSPS